MDVEKDFPQQSNEIRRGMIVIVLMCTVLTHLNLNIVVS